MNINKCNKWSKSLYVKQPFYAFLIFVNQTKQRWQRPEHRHPGVRRCPSPWTSIGAWNSWGNCRGKTIEISHSLSQNTGCHTQSGLNMVERCWNQERLHLFTWNILKQDREYMEDVNGRSTSLRRHCDNPSIVLLLERRRPTQVSNQPQCGACGAPGRYLSWRT